MKKVEITMVTIENGTATVTYITGTVRKYAEENLPKTVLFWMAARQEAAEAPAEEPTDFVLVDTPITDFVLIETPGAPMMTDLVPATTTALTPIETETTEEAIEAVQVTSEALRAQAIKEAIETATKAVNAITKAVKVAVKVAKAVAENAPEVAKRATVGAVWTVDRLVDLYYWVTTYLPIAARWLMVHLIWTIQGAVPAIQEALRKATGAVRMAGLGIVRAASAVAGWGFVGALAGVSISIKVARMAAEGWKLREEIIAENKAAA